MCFLKKAHQPHLGRDRPRRSPGNVPLLGVLVQPVVLQPLEGGVGAQNDVAAGLLFPT